MKPIKVLIADDHAVVRQGITSILKTEKDIQVVGEAEDGMQTIEKVKALKPDVLLLDIAMPNINGLEAVGLVRDSVPESAIVVLSMYDNENYIQRVLNSGALGYVLKASDPSEISRAIRSVHRREYFLSSEIKKKIIISYINNPDPKPELNRYEKLSAQEKCVFLLIVQGKSIKEIAENLFVTPKTVEKHRTAISHKLGIKNKVEMTHYAIKNGILNLDLMEV